MTLSLIRKVSGGYRIDGLDLLGGSRDLPPGSRNAEAEDCHQTYSTVKRVGNVVAFFAKATTAKTRDICEWGYRVKKGAVEVDVLVYDTWNRHNQKFEGHYPPPISAWEKCGWEIKSQFTRPLTTEKARQ